jgi:DNA primase
MVRLVSFTGSSCAAPQAIAYLKKRGLTGEIAARFGLGFAPDAWDSLRQVFADYQPLALVEAGLVIDKSDEKVVSASAMTVSVTA